MFPPTVPSVVVTQVLPGAVLLDVREDDEWQAGHIEGATHIPLTDIPQRLEEIPTHGDLVVLCRMGGRSAQAVAWLSRNGVDAVNLEGGMGAWVQAGLPIVSETGAEPYVR